MRKKNELGTVGSLKLIKNLEKNFILTNCDNLYRFNLRELFSYHSSNNNDLTLAISKKKIEVPYGVCEINSKNALKSINEKPSYNLFVNTGLYIINKRIIKHIPKKKKFGIDELINILIDKKYELQTFKINENQWFDTGQWDQFKKTFDEF